MVLIIIVGLVVGAAAILLTALGNPANMVLHCLFLRTLPASGCTRLESFSIATEIIGLGLEQ